MITKVNFTDVLLERIPEFADTYQEHLTRYDKVLLHVLFGDLSDFVAAAYERDQKDLVARVIDYINDAAISTDDNIRGMAQVSFLMHLPRFTGYEFMRSKLNDEARRLLAIETGEKIA